MVLLKRQCISPGPIDHHMDFTTLKELELEGNPRFIQFCGLSTPDLPQRRPQRRDSLALHLSRIGNLFWFPFLKMGTARWTGKPFPYTRSAIETIEHAEELPRRHEQQQEHYNTIGRERNGTNRCSVSSETIVMRSSISICSLEATADTLVGVSIKSCKISP